MFRKRVSIYDITNGSELMSEELSNSDDQHIILRKLYYIENRCVLVYYTATNRKSPYDKKHKLLKIDLKDFTSQIMTIDKDFLLIFSIAYLEVGFLILSHKIMTKWRTDCWPFEKMESEVTFKRTTDELLTLSANMFARVSDKTVSIWDSDLNLLREIKTNCYELKALGNDFLLIKSCYSIIKLFNFRSGELINTISNPFQIRCFFETPDKEFLVLAGQDNIFFHNLKGSFDYSIFETPHPHQFQNEKVKMLRNNKFIRRSDSERSVMIFDYEK